MPKKGAKGEETTEEERLLLLQQKSQAEEETARKKEETLTLYLKDKLQKEKRNAAVNQLKLTESWRRILRQTRDGELLADAAVLQQTSERKLDELNSIVQRMLWELREAELQADQVQRDHLQQVERLWQQQQQRLAGLQQRWESSLLDLSSMCSADKEKMLAGFRQQNLQLVDLYLPAQMHDRGMSEYIQKVQQEVVNYYQNTHQDLDVMRKDVQNQPDGTDLNREALEKTTNVLKTLDDRICQEQQETSAKLRKVKRLKDQSFRLRQQIFYCQTEQNILDQDWTNTRTKLNKKRLQLQDQLARDRKEARKKLAELSIQGAAATSNLQSVISKAQKLLQVAELCNKLQNQQEVIPEPSKVGQLRMGAEQIQEVWESPELQLLQEFLNSALLHREALRNRSKDLRWENQQLQVLLDQRDDSLQGHLAPLPVLQVPVRSGPVVPERRHTIIEAAHIVKHCLLDGRG